MSAFIEGKSLTSSLILEKALPVKTIINIAHKTNTLDNVEVRMMSVAVAR